MRTVLLCSLPFVMESAVHQLSPSISPLFFFQNVYAYMFVDHTAFYDIWSLEVSKTSEM